MLPGNSRPLGLLSRKTSTVRRIPSLWGWCSRGDHHTIPPPHQLPRYPKSFQRPQLLCLLPPASAQPLHGNAVKLKGSCTFRENNLAEVSFISIKCKHASIFSHRFHLTEQSQGGEIISSFRGGGGGSLPTGLNKSFESRRFQFAWIYTATWQGAFFSPRAALMGDPGGWAVWIWALASSCKVCGEPQSGN